MAEGTDTPVENPQAEAPGEVDAGPETQQAQEEAQPQETQEQPEQPPVDPVQQLEERLFQKMASWTGRREKDLMTAIGTLIDQRIPKGQAAQGGAEEPSIFDNPDAWLDRRMERKNAEKTQFFQKAIMSAANEVLRNPALASVKDALAGEIKAAAPRMRMDLPPEVAGSMLAKEAALNFFSKRAMQPQNPLAGNKPTGVPMGGLKGATAKTATKSHIPKEISPAAQRYIKWMGAGEKELEEYFKE